MKKPVLKKTKVTRKFLLDLADKIHNPKTKTFLRLCTGTLQNGPDPEDQKRPMHCGLGELYYAMTGVEPERMPEVDEDEVVEEAVRRSAFGAHTSENQKNAVLAKINKIKLPASLKAALQITVEEAELNGVFEGGEADAFSELLSDIPEKNDDPCGHGTGCSPAQFRARSARVASVFRKAAKLLPAGKS